MKSFDLVYDSAWDRERRERERGKEGSHFRLLSMGNTHSRSHNNTLHTHTRTHTRHSSKVENNESEICKIQETISVCVCIQYGWSV